MINNYRKHFGESREFVMWKLSWVNFLMDLATIPVPDETKNKSDEEIVVDIDDEEADLRKLIEG